MILKNLTKKNIITISIFIWIINIVLFILALYHRNGDWLMLLGLFTYYNIIIWIEYYFKKNQKSWEDFIPNWISNTKLSNYLKKNIDIIFAILLFVILAIIIFYIPMKIFNLD